MTEAEPRRFAVFRVVDVQDVVLDLPSQYPAVTLAESEPPMRVLVFPVGLPEGTAMAQALRRMEGRRPMTHELFVQVLQRARIDVIALRLVGREEGNLLAELDLMTPAGREVLDCRPSDGIVLALRMPVPAPILVDERLLDQAGDVAPIRDPEAPEPDAPDAPHVPPAPDALHTPHAPDATDATDATDAPHAPHAPDAPGSDQITP